MNSLYNWKSWYGTARNKEPYISQAKELVKILNTWAGEYESVLDVGCGDKRLKPYFQGKKYSGFDDLEILDGETFKDSSFDVVFTSLVLVHFDKESGEKYFEKMMNLGKKVFLFEECLEETEGKRKDGGSLEKYNHDYFHWSENLIVAGISNVNEKWRWYLFKGNK